MKIKTITIAQTIERVYICGDIHGEFDALMRSIEILNIESAAIIIAGDCGFGLEEEAYYKTLYNKIRRRLSKLNIFLLMVRGNHDSPAYFDGQRVNYKRFKCVSDYTVISLEGRNILCIGGGVSVDRTRRIAQIGVTLYWEDENVVYNPEAISQLPPINVVVTHSAPSYCFPRDKGNIEKWLIADRELESDLDKERGRLDEIYGHLRRDNHPIEEWYYGHYHSSKLERIDNVNYHLLDVMEFKVL